MTKVTCCPDKACAGHAEKVMSAAEMSLAPPFWSITWDVFAWMGQRRFARHWSIPQICAELKDRYPSVIEEVRGEGLMVGLKLKPPVGDMISAAQDQHLLVVPAGDNVMRLLPALIVNDAEIGEAMTRLGKAMAALQRRAA